MAAVDVIDSYLEALPGAARNVAHGKWGLSVPADDWPVEIGLRLTDGLLTVKALALTDSEGLDPWILLWWNRSTRHARFACTQGREIWVHADLPAAAVAERELDRVLGLVMEGATAVRDFQRARRVPAQGRGGL